MAFPVNRYKYVGQRTGHVKRNFWPIGGWRKPAKPAPSNYRFATDGAADFVTAGKPNTSGSVALTPSDRLIRLQNAGSCLPAQLAEREKSAMTDLFCAAS
jgi:hypothetical protein